MSGVSVQEMQAFRALLRQRGYAPREFKVHELAAAPSEERGRIAISRRGGPAHDYEPRLWLLDFGNDLDRHLYD